MMHYAHYAWNEFLDRINNNAILTFIKKFLHNLNVFSIYKFKIQNTLK